MEITESMIEGLVKSLTGGKTTITYHPDGNKGQEGARELVLDFQRPWKRYDMIETLEEKLGVKFPPGETLHTDETNKFLRKLCVKVNYFYKHISFFLTSDRSTMSTAASRARTRACSTSSSASLSSPSASRPPSSSATRK